MTRALLFMLMAILVWSCQEEIFVELQYNEDQLVVESVLNDTSTTQYVRLSRTIDFYDEQPVPEPVPDAIVTFSHGTETDTLIFDPSSGKYYIEDYALIYDEIYTLDIYDRGNHYRASERLVQTVATDSAYAAFLPDRPFRPAGFYPVYSGVLRPGDHYLRFIYSRNDTVFDERQDYFIFDNSLIGDTLDFIELPFSLQPGDRVEVETYSLSQSVFNYFTEFTALLFNDGGIFSPPPTNPRSNVVNLTNPELKPFGYFQVSSVTRNVFITPDSLPEF